MNVQMLSRNVQDEREQEHATTVRPSATSLLCVDSADRSRSVVASQFETVSPYRFTIAKKQNILTGFFRRIALTEVVFPYYIPNINPRTNTIKIIYNGGAEQTLTLDDGFYTPTVLAATLETELQTLTGNPAVTVTYVNGIFVIDVQAGNDIIIFSPTDTYGLFDLLGGTDAWINPGGQILISRVTRCRYTDYIDIVCNQLTYNQELKDGSTSEIIRDVIARIYLEGENDQPIPVNVKSAATDVEDTVPGTYPFTIYRQFSTPKYIEWNKDMPIANLTFEVYDDTGALLSGNNFEVVTGVAAPDYLLPNWRMTLLVSED